MTFLVWTMREAAILAGLTASAIIGLYFLKLGHRRVIVSSSLVWRRVLEGQPSYSRRDRLRTAVSVALAIVIALLMVLSIGRPQSDWLSGRSRRMVIVLDTSPSMNARTSDGKTRWQHAVDRARALLGRGGAEEEFRIADTSGSTQFAFTSDRSEAREMIDKLSPGPAAPRFPIVDSRDSVYFVSDGVGIRDVPAFVEAVSVFEAADNVAITAFDIRAIPAHPLEYQAYLEIANHGKPGRVEVTLQDSSRQTLRRTARLAAQETLKETFDVSSFAGGNIQASIQADADSLQADDVAYGYLPVRRRVRTLLVTNGSSDLMTLLKLDPHVDLRIANPRSYREEPDIDAYIFDRFAPDVAPAGPALIIGAPAAPWLPRPQGVVVKPEITTWFAEHPIMQSVPVHDISVDRAQRIDPGRLSAIAASRQAPLILVSDHPRWVMITFDLASSDFPKQVGFPVFIENVLTWLNGDAPPSRPRRPDLSDLNRSSFKSNVPAVPNRGGARHAPWFYMLLGAAVLLLIEWCTFHRRVTV